MVFKKLKKILGGSETVSDEEYIEIDVGKEEKQKKIFVRLFTLKDYEEVNEILNSLREGYTIVMIDIKVLRQRDPIELKRAVAKIKKTVEALEGSIAGFGENIVIATPSFAKIYKEEVKPKEEKKTKFDYI
ncbi:MAG: cell division protein SepF [Candidatus Pacearchaeota archaeon]